MSLPRMSEARRIDQAEMRHARPIVRERSGGDCEVRIEGVCLGRATNMHHRKPKSQYGRSVPANLLDLCGDGVRGCHGYIEHNRSESYEQGWLVHSWADPALIPIATPGEAPVAGGSNPPAAATVGSIATDGPWS